MRSARRCFMLSEDEVVGRRDRTEGVVTGWCGDYRVDAVVGRQRFEMQGECSSPCARGKGVSSA